MVNNPELINKMINNINKLDDELIKEAIQEVELEDITKQKYFNNIDEAIKVYTEFRRFKNNGFIETIDPVFFFNLTDCILKRYKELEEKETEKFLKILEDNSKTTLAKEVMELRKENKRLKAFEDFKLKNEFIPISVIQNKIDEYREKRNKLADGHFWDNEKNINEDTSLFIAIETLKLLLEERNKSNE